MEREDKVVYCQQASNPTRIFLSPIASIISMGLNRAFSICHIVSPELSPTLALAKAQTWSIWVQSSHYFAILVSQAEDGRHQRRMVHLTEERIQELEHQVAAARKAQVWCTVQSLQTQDIAFDSLAITPRKDLCSRVRCERGKFIESGRFVALRAGLWRVISRMWWSTFDCMWLSICGNDRCSLL